MALDHRLLTAAALALFCSQPLSRAADPIIKTPPPLDPANFDPSVKPGDDFFHYADGDWLKNNPIPPEYTSWGSFNELDERNKAILHAILDNCAAAVTGPSGGANTSMTQKVGDFYASGMDEAGIEANGVKPLEPEFARIAALHDRKDLAGEVAHLQMLGQNVMLGFEVEPDEKNSGANIMRVKQGGLGLPDRDYYLKTDEQSKSLLAQYQAHVAKMFTLLGDTPPVAAANAGVVVAFETELAQASKTKVELRLPEANYHKMSPVAFAQSAPGFDWTAFFTGLGVANPGDLDIQQPEFLTRAAQLAATEPLEHWQTYLRWQLIHGTAPCLSKVFVDENFAFFGRTLTGATVIRPRWKRILAATDLALGEDLGQLYVQKAFTPDAKARSLAMVSDLKAALREKLATLDWMSPETRELAVAKLDAMAVKIGYPDKWRDYGALEIKQQPYVDNVLAANTFEEKRILAKLGQPVDKTEWGMTPPTVNAYYSPERNEIVFPAGILQPPFFSAAADDAVNYGGIGVVIGHEMTHGFDDQGRQYDAQGNLRNWWKFLDAKRFQERGEKIVAQFNAYEPLPGAHVNGQLTEGENIADLGGTKIAYAALEKALDRQGPDARAKKIDDLTPEQRFFLSFGQIWRTNMREEMLRLRLNTDPHSPPQYRVDGPLSNLPEFQKAFNIPAGSPMVRPEDQRVQIW